MAVYICCLFLIKNTHKQTRRPDFWGRFSDCTPCSMHPGIQKTLCWCCYKHSAVHLSFLRLSVYFNAVITKKNLSIFLADWLCTADFFFSFLPSAWMIEWWGWKGSFSLFQYKTISCIFKNLLYESAVNYPTSAGGEFLLYLGNSKTFAWTKLAWAWT